MSFRERALNYYKRITGDAEAATEEYYALENERTQLQNEARYQEEPSFAADLERKRSMLERESRQLIFCMEEPARSQLQGRCQILLQEISRPEDVQVRLREVNTRLAELVKIYDQPDDGVSVDILRDAASF